MFIVVIFILYVYKSYKHQIKLRMEHEREVLLQKQQMQEKIHQEELSHKEIQLSMMRNYLQKKIDVVEKLNSIVPNENKHIVLSESDWDELEVFLNSVENLFGKRLKQKYRHISIS